MKYLFNQQKHLHTLDGKALTGTSSVVGVLDKPGLTWWASSEAVKTLGWTSPKIKKGGRVIGEVPAIEREKIADQVLSKLKKLDKTEYLACLDEAYKAHSVRLRSSAEAGTDLHAELERFVKFMMSGKVGESMDFDERIQPFRDWAFHAVKNYLWSEAHCYDQDLWVGGISDVGVELNAQVIETPDGQIEVPNGTLAVIDFKSSKEVYTSHFIQAAGYALQVEKNGLFNADGTRREKFYEKFGALIIVPFGGEIVYPEIRMKVDEYKEGFIHSLALYRLLGMDRSEFKK